MNNIDLGQPVYKSLRPYIGPDVIFGRTRSRLDNTMSQQASTQLYADIYNRFMFALPSIPEENLEEKMDQDIENPTNNNEQYRRDLFMKNILEMKTKLLYINCYL